MVVFVCSAYAGDIKGNMRRARQYCRQEYEAGNVPIAPHLLFMQFLCAHTERYDGLMLGIELLARCDEVHVYGRPSCGMRMEIEEAEKMSLPVVYMGEDIQLCEG